MSIEITKTETNKYQIYHIDGYYLFLSAPEARELLLKLTEALK